MMESLLQDNHVKYQNSLNGPEHLSGTESQILQPLVGRHSLREKFTPLQRTSTIQVPSKPSQLG